MPSIPLSLIRYLIALRVTGPYVHLPVPTAVEFSWILGKAVADRLPAVQARPWHKALAQWETCFDPSAGRYTLLGRRGLIGIPERPWPIDAVIFFYPGKDAYGEGEPILCELKLMGEAADHGLFLEVILPALEAAGQTACPGGRGRNPLWGHYDIQSIHVARGPRWEPLAHDGRLDLNSRPTGGQWSEGWADRYDPGRTYTELTWLAPFDLSSASTVRRILTALVERMEGLFLRKNQNLWEMLAETEAENLRNAVLGADHHPLTRKNLRSSSNPWPGRWRGRQQFPRPLKGPFVPYLALAALLHVGKHTHYGCGTFLLD